ncbi:DUF4124 domain-containing protein [Kushneria indalinina]|uniref:Uncharacterized protein DUF4124 n=1 Tax=Kushneria indalinina DSM 14324 TaxID=1122140 RepID=A0A3D9DWV4_9GAMM|nr:DUF4124 domain-containing protein [Kushneria indalinina]REC95263.1 uncharacterized protein DUF4124 [Kushneria indalinina DSM 14324]
MPGRFCYLMLWTVVVWLLLVAAMPQARAAVYRHTDAQGNIVWSDRPGGTRAEVRAPRVLSPSKASDATAAIPPAPAVFVPYQRLTLKPRTAPVTLDQARRGIPLRLEIAPRLRAGDRVQLRVDGRRHQSPLASRVLVAMGLTPGRHALVAELLDSSGTVRQRSPVMTLEIQPVPGALK